jgi:hypothetical protein
VTDTWLTLCYYATLAASLAAGVLALTGRARPWRPLGALALAAASVQALLMILTLGRPLLSGAYETLAALIFCLNCLALLPCGNQESSRRLSGLVWLGSAALSSVFLLASRKLYPDWYMYEYLWTRLFFSLRSLAMAGMLYGALAALASCTRGLDQEARKGLLARSRNFLLLSTSVYLAGELAGFTWRLNWLGDYWSWNRNFLESTLYFLLATAALHLPPRWAADIRIRAGVQAAPGLLIIVMMLLHLLPEA